MVTNLSLKVYGIYAVLYPCDKDIYRHVCQVLLNSKYGDECLQLHSGTSNHSSHGSRVGFILDACPGGFLLSLTLRFVVLHPKPCLSTLVYLIIESCTTSTVPNCGYQCIAPLSPPSWGYCGDSGDLTAGSVLNEVSAPRVGNLTEGNLNFYLIYSP